MASDIEGSLRGALQALYCRHHNDVTSMTCYLERQLPLREPFYQLKRVPHFQVRDDLHHCEAPAYSPIMRLESATPEDIALRGRAGCRRVLVEGDLGTGKTFLCYHLLHKWADAHCPSKRATMLGKSHYLDDITSFKMLVYVDCVRLPVSDFLGKCAATVKRHVHVVASALLEMVSPSDGRLFLDRVCDWLLANQPEVCVIYDNVDSSDTWGQLIEETLREGEGFGKIVVCVTPGRVPKNNIDSLFYCYGLHPDYSAKLVVSRLKRTCEDFAERASLPKALDSSQELLRNPLTQTLLATCLKDMDPASQPLTQFDFIEGLVSSAMVGDSYPVTMTDSLTLPSPTGLAPPMSPTGALGLSPASSPTSLMSICETVAFECLSSNTNYFSKYKFPTHFWSKHLCDCRILHEIHHAAQQGKPVVSFTSRCIRDYLASKRVCRYLLSDRDSERFLNTLVHKRQFHSVVKFCIRQFVKLDRLDMVQILIERLLAADPKNWNKQIRTLNSKPFTPFCPFTRGRLMEQREVLAWLRETDFSPKLMPVVTQHFPDILEICYGECPVETLQDFVQVSGRSPEMLVIREVVLYMDGMFTSSDLALDLARSLRAIPSITSVIVCLRLVVDTAFVVNFLCEVFDGNDHVIDLTLEGPFNSAENLTPAQYRRVNQVFGARRTGTPSSVQAPVESLGVPSQNELGKSSAIDCEQNVKDFSASVPSDKIGADSSRGETLENRGTSSVVGSDKEAKYFAIVPSDNLETDSSAEKLGVLSTHTDGLDSERLFAVPSDKFDINPSLGETPSNSTAQTDSMDSENRVKDLSVPSDQLRTCSTFVPFGECLDASDKPDMPSCVVPSADSLQFSDKQGKPSPSVPFEQSLDAADKLGKPYVVPYADFRQKTKPSTVVPFGECLDAADKPEMPSNGVPSAGVPSADPAEKHLPENCGKSVPCCHCAEPREFSSLVQNSEGNSTLNSHEEGMNQETESFVSDQNPPTKGRNHTDHHSPRTQAEHKHQPGTPTEHNESPAEHTDIPEASATRPQKQEPPAHHKRPAGLLQKPRITLRTSKSAPGSLRLMIPKEPLSLESLLSLDNGAVFSPDIPLERTPSDDVTPPPFGGMASELGRPRESKSDLGSPSISGFYLAPEELFDMTSPESSSNSLHKPSTELSPNSLDNRSTKFDNSVDSSLRSFDKPSTDLDNSLNNRSACPNLDYSVDNRSSECDNSFSRSSGSGSGLPSLDKPVFVLNATKDGHHLDRPAVLGLTSTKDGHNLDKSAVLDLNYKDGHQLNKSSLLDSKATKDGHHVDQLAVGGSNSTQDGHPKSIRPCTLLMKPKDLLQASLQKSVSASQLGELRAKRTMGDRERAETKRVSFRLDSEDPVTSATTNDANSVTSLVDGLKTAESVTLDVDAKTVTSVLDAKTVTSDVDTKNATSANTMTSDGDAKSITSDVDAKTLSSQAELTSQALPKTSQCPNRCCCSSVALKNLSLEHINYHHRVSYILACWPDIFHKLELRKSNLNAAAPTVTDKLTRCQHLHTLILDHCHVTSTALLQLLQMMNDVAKEQPLVLKVLGLNLLSSARHFTRSDARKANFKPSLSLQCCQALAQFISLCPTLQELSLRHNGLDDVTFHVIAEAASKSEGLTSLDLTGNVIGDGARSDIISLMTQSRNLTTLYLHENSISPDLRSELVERCVDLDAFRLSL